MEDRGPRPLFFLLLYLSYVTPTAIGLLLDRTDIVAPMVDRWPEQGRGLMEEKEEEEEEEEKEEEEKEKEEEEGVHLFCTDKDRACPSSSAKYPTHHPPSPSRGSAGSDQED